MKTVIQGQERRAKRDEKPDLTIKGRNWQPYPYLFYPHATPDCPTQGIGYRAEFSRWLYFTPDGTYWFKLPVEGIDLRDLVIYENPRQLVPEEEKKAKKEARKVARMAEMIKKHEPHTITAEEFEEIEAKERRAIERRRARDDSKSGL